MNNELEVINKYKEFGVISANELYLPISTAGIFIDECNKYEVAVVGVDFFYITEERKIVPITPINSIDASMITINKSWKQYVMECNKFVLKALIQEKKKDNNQFYSFVLSFKNEL
ncbi:hypothetical protein [Paenibacillus sp. UMB4589-SE434]|uniref:hypothetical protein n=1 Tax=Paenibacillus sp. UMB4589-SE434 TaxID=3046314 RepID=UPI00254CFA36|nr:hypothetical protein [Paenibacillus sp. UMB4589-SE434]MDK8181889.1 hypothetical protein [Paenibacillus sp. UMB4589-SE434]